MKNKMQSLSRREREVAALERRVAELGDAASGANGDRTVPGTISNRDVDQVPTRRNVTPSLSSVSRWSSA